MQEASRNAAIQILNDANLSSEAPKKVAHIAQLKELLVRKDPTLLPEFLPEMVTMQVDPSPSVRKALVAFLIEAAMATSSARALQQAAASVSAMFADSSVQVQKAALVACNLVLRAALAVLAARPSDPEAKACWGAARSMQQASAALVTAPGTHEAVRLVAVKLLEGVVLLLSGDAAPLLPSSAAAGWEEGQGGAPAVPPRLPQPAILAQDAAAGCKLLAGLLRPAAVASAPGPLTLVAIRAAAAIATARPSLLGRLLPSLITLAKEGGLRATGGPAPPPLEVRGSQLSLGNALRSGLVAVLRGRAPAGLPWRERVAEALRGLGAGQAAEAALRAIQSQELKDSKSAKAAPPERQRPPAEPGPAKRPRASTPPHAPTASTTAAAAGGTQTPPPSARKQPSPPPPKQQQQKLQQQQQQQQQKQQQQQEPLQGLVALLQQQQGTHSKSPQPPQLKPQLKPQPQPQAQPQPSLQHHMQPPRPQLPAGAVSRPAPGAGGHPPTAAGQLPQPTPTHPPQQPRPASHPPANTWAASQPSGPPAPPLSSSSGAPGGGAAGLPLAPPPAPLPPSQQQVEVGGGGPSQVAAPPGQPPLTSPSDMAQVTLLLPALISASDASLLPAFLDSLAANSPAVLADLVIALMLASELPSLDRMATALEQTRTLAPPDTAATPPQRTPTPPPPALLTATATYPAQPQIPPPPTFPRTQLPAGLPGSQTAPSRPALAPPAARPHPTPTPMVRMSPQELAALEQGGRGTPPLPAGPSSSKQPVGGAPPPPPPPQAPGPAARQPPPQAGAARGATPPPPIPPAQGGPNAAAAGSRGLGASGGAAGVSPAAAAVHQGTSVPSAAAAAAMLRRPLGAGGESSRRPPLGQPTLPSDLPASAAAQQLVGDAGAGAAAAAGGQASEGGRGLAQALAKALSLAAGRGVGVEAGRGQAAGAPPALVEALARGAPLVLPSRLSSAASGALCLSALRRLAASRALPAPAPAAAAGPSPPAPPPALPPSALPLQEQLLARLTASTQLLHPPPLPSPTQHTPSPAGPAQQQQGAGGGEGGEGELGEEAAQVLLEAALAAVDAGQGLGLPLRWLAALLAAACRQAAPPLAPGPAQPQDSLGQGVAADGQLGGAEEGVGGQGQGRRRAGPAAARPVLRIKLAEPQPQPQPQLPTSPADAAAPDDANQQNKLVAGDEAGAGDQVMEGEGEGAAAGGPALEGGQAAAPHGGGEDEEGGEGEEEGGEGAGAVRCPAVLPVVLSGSAYETCLLKLLEGLRQRRAWRALRSLLAEAPALPCPALPAFLAQLVAAGGEAATAGLGAAREALVERPALRWALLRLVLSSTRAPDPDTRSKAVRLAVNQLAALPGLAALIQADAAASLQALLGTPPEGSGPGGTTPLAWSTEEAARHCELYTTLCVRRPELLGGLLTTYAAAPGPVRAALLAASEGLARALGCSNPQLLAAVRHPPPGSEALVTHLVEVVVSGLLPSEALLAAVRQRVADSGDVALLAPLVGALDKAELLALLPRLLQVGGLALKGLYRKLTCAPSTAGEPVFSPAELLVALHGLDPARDGLAPRTLMAAVDAALHAPDIFPQQAVAQALQQMECCTPLPLLFMRTTITSLKAAPRLRPFIADLLARLISKQVWLDRAQWRGFLMLVEATGRPYFPLLLQLPAPVLERALGLGPSDPGEPVLKQTTAVQLAAWSSSPDCKLQVVHSVATLLDRIMQAHKAREAAADAATAEVAEAVARAEAAMARAAAQPAVVKTESPAAEGTGPEAAVTATHPAASRASTEPEDGDAEAAQVAATAEPEGASPSRRADEFDLDFEQLAEEEKGGEGDQEMAGA